MEHSGNSFRPTYIGISGAIGVGKDTFAARLIEQAHNRWGYGTPVITVRSFAQPIREMCEYLGFNYTDREAKEYEQRSIPSSAEVQAAIEECILASDEDKARLYAYIETALWEIAFAETLTTRDLALVIGAAGRKVREDFWITLLEEWVSIHPLPSIVLIPDVRMRNEQEFCDKSIYLFEHGCEDFMEKDNPALDAAEKREPNFPHRELFYNAHLILGRDELMLGTSLIQPHVSL